MVMEQQTKALGVYQGIHKAAEILAKKGIGKNQRNQAQNFSYRGIDDILNAVSSALVEARLVILPEIEDAEIVTLQNEKQGRQGSFTQIIYTAKMVGRYRIVSVDDGSSHCVSVPAHSFDMSDKSINKALSAAYKYMCVQVFSIPLEGMEDQDADHIEPSPQLEAAPDDVDKLRDAIRGSASLDDLQKAFATAYRYAGNRKKAELQEEFKSLYDARKAAFEEAA